MRHTVNRLNMLLALMATIALSSCHHKDLFMEKSGDVKVVYDWRYAPDANPASMVAIFYSDSYDGFLRFILEGKDGGDISLPVATFSGLSVNGDDNDWVKLRNINTIDNYETYTIDAWSTEAYGLPTRSIPRAEGTEDERMAQTPGMLWTCRTDSIVHALDGEETITFYPREAVCHYTVDIYDVANLEYVNRAEIDGTISGMAEGYNHGKKCPTDNHVTMPFSLTSDVDEHTLHAEFLTFGESANDPGKHILTVYLYLTDGSKWYYNFDVTSQVHDAADPTHVHITLREMPIPHPITDEGGFRPNINDWQTEEIEMQM